MKDSLFSHVETARRFIGEHSTIKEADPEPQNTIVSEFIKRKKAQVKEDKERCKKPRKNPLASSIVFIS
jgi:hypothetical protein